MLQSIHPTLFENEFYFDLLSSIGNIATTVQFLITFQCTIVIQTPISLLAGLQNMNRSSLTATEDLRDVINVEEGFDSKGSVKYTLD